MTPAPSWRVASDGSGRPPRDRAPAACARRTHKSPPAKSFAGWRTNWTWPRFCRRSTSSQCS
eukprot:2828273-Lingulodinium_polyedra.AAC.1